MLRQSVKRFATAIEWIFQQGKPMKTCKLRSGQLGVICLLALSAGLSIPQVIASLNTVQVHMVITDQAFSDNNEPPVLRRENVQVKQGENALKLDQVIPAQGDNASLSLFILIDDTLDPRIGTNLNDLRDFINAQPASTQVGIGYMSNATFQIAQNFSADHALVSKSLRLPRGRLSTMDSPYLSLISLVKSWPQEKVRREVLMLSDGIDHLHGNRSIRVSTMPGISVNADSASATCQRYGVIVYSIYAVGAGRLGRNAWEAQMGQSGIAKITDETGGEFFALLYQNAVTFKPYLDRLQKIFENQYYVVFQAVPGKKVGLQRVDISTSVPDADIAAAVKVWVDSK
jgi:hypothetical protein